MEDCQRCHTWAVVVASSCHREPSRDDTRIKIVPAAAVVEVWVVVWDSVLLVVDYPTRSQHLNIDDAWAD